MTFRNKILFSIWGVVLGLLVITFFIINYWTRSRMEETFSAELRTGFSTVSVHEKLQSAQLIRACVVIAESPRLRAVAELGDSKTAYQLLQELNRTTLSQLFILTDREGRPLVQLLRGVKDEWDISRSEPITSALHFVAATDVWPIRGILYRIVSVPILIETELVGSLTIGFEITRSDIATLKRATNTDLLLIDNRSTVLSTLDSAEAAALQPAIIPFEQSAFGTGGDTVGSALKLATSSETYLGMAFPLHHSAMTDSNTVSYLMIKPLSSEVRRSMASILGTFGLVSLVFLGITTIIGLVISKSMTRPIRELVKGTTEISRGNYDFPIQVRGKDELGFLASRFMEMSASLKDKITQLGKLNQDLLERNRTLDETLRQLQAAQDELVRSERLAATGKMTAQLAHEINNPIHNIQSCLKTALGRLPAQIKGRDLIDVAYDEVNRLSRLTAQMLNFYRNSLVEEELKLTNLNDLIEEVIAVSRSELSESKIRLTTQIDPGLPRIRGSRDKLKQVLLNLFSNARDAMPEGGTLGITACAQNGTVRLSVRDTGVGIPQENLDRIFDAFFTTKAKVSGVGLGLSVSYGIVNQHRGSIEVESAVDRGSTFTVVLPYEVSS
jgi:signal transduction histidine kinase